MKNNNENSVVAKTSVKKIIAILAVIAVIICVGIFASSCKKLPDKIVVVAPDGATALSVARLVEEKKIDEMNVEVKIVAPNEIATESIKADFAVVPSNVAANLYNKGSNIKILDVVTNGNLFILSSADVQVELSSLVGKKIYSIGQGSLPDLIFQSILAKNNIAINFGDTAIDGKITISYSAEGSEVVAKLMKAKQQGKEEYGLLAEPAVSMAIGKGLYQKFDLQEIWKTQTNSETLGYPQAVLVVNGKNTDNTKLVKKVRALFADNGTWLIQNTEKAVSNIKSIYAQTSLSANISQEVVRRCNINTISVMQNKDYYLNMLNALMKINDGAAIGKSLPNDNFYYNK